MKRVIPLIALSLIILLAFPLEAQKKKKKKGDDPAATSEEKKGPKKIADEVKNSSKIEGLFTLYQDSTSGKLSMEIPLAKLGSEFIHFYYVENSVLEASSFRGFFRGTNIIKIEKYFDKIRLIKINTSSYFDETKAISNAAEANLSHSVLFSTEVKAGSEDEGAYLIGVDDLFLTDAMGLMTPPPPPKPDPNAFNPGSISKEKTTYNDIRNYPENTDIIVDYVFENKSPKNFGSRAVVDARNITITAQHSLIAVPDNDFVPRYDDPRVGYFTTQVTDMTSKSSTPFRDPIDRWHLKKKDPESELSEPVKPITWWIENTTPKEIRPIIRRAALQWNLAFEKAGFKNAMVVKEQPDDAEWDAGDIRYNVLRWASSPIPPFGGYGPNFTDPRTGQVLGADVMLEYGVLGNMNRAERIFAKTGLVMDEHLGDFPGGDHACTLSHFAQINQNFGNIAHEVFASDDEEQGKMLEEFLHFLILHEIGHTLGLNHNMKSSQLHPLSDINNKAVTAEKGLTGSVMDYPSINYALDRDNQGQYWTMRPGPYDEWAIEYGYKPVSGQEELDEILARSTRPELAFGNDADDMRWAGKAIDPRINVGDMTSNSIDYSIERIKLANVVLNELLAKHKKEKNRSYDELNLSYLITTGQLFQSINTVSRFIGGVYLDRAFVGQEGGSQPFRPVDLATQQKAMRTLSKYLFAPDAFRTNEELFAHLQNQRRGFDHFGGPEDPKLHSRYLNMHNLVLDHLLHQNVLNRIVDSELYGNDYSLSSMMTDLNNAIFKADANSSVNYFRQNLQIEYTNRLIDIIGANKANYLHAVRSMALYNLKAIRTMASRNVGNTSSRAHREHLKLIIDKALDD